MFKWGVQGTYIVEVSFHMYKSEGLFKENYEHAAWNSILIKPIFVHISFLCENE